MSYSIKFFLDGLPKTFNSNGRAHWGAKTAEVNHWKRAVSWQIGAKKPKVPLTKARVTLVRFSSSEPDFDGLVSSFKATLDGLVECGVLRDDRMSTISQPVYRWEKVKPTLGRIFVAVEELPESSEAPEVYSGEGFVRRLTPCLVTGCHALRFDIQSAGETGNKSKESGK